ncbi:VanZ family protein [Agromyces protaetiae]|uniref:VanZ family protein n=1 Tax=Agromyces protaetiae TaxID=2509455 RepID=A0A4V0YGV7_9MICO|nr:VanZ family protein [Agromyces protaetiae]QAY72551.1 VanZ family protein [Agromyces protaetiae]
MTPDQTAVSRRALTIATIAYAGGALAVLVVPSVADVFQAVHSWLHDGLGWRWVRPSFVDFPANVVLFFPLGLLAVLWLGRFWRGFWVAVAMSVAAELVQAVIPDRVASPRDIVGNALGAALGAFVAVLIIRARRDPDSDSV